MRPSSTDALDSLNFQSIMTEICVALILHEAPYFSPLKHPGEFGGTYWQVGMVL